MNEWYPWGLQISLHIRSPEFSELGSRGYSGVNFGHLKSEVFRNRGGYSGVNFGHLKSEVFRNGGGLSGLQFQKGAFWKIWTKIYCLRNVYRKVVCITDSLSHTTYVETNKVYKCVYLHLPVKVPDICQRQICKK